MLYVIFLLPLLVMIVGYLMYKYPPKKINYVIGYRTFKSMKNEEAWKLANQYCGKLWIKIGLAMLVIAIILFTLFNIKVLTYTEDILAIIVIAQIMPMLLSIFAVEKKIKNLNK